MSKDDIATEALLEFLNAVEAGVAAAKRLVSEAKGVMEASAVLEQTFTCLKFEKHQGARLGEYSVAHKAANLPDKFGPAYGILRKNNATIANRYLGPNYHFSYWLFGGKDRIYRQKVKTS